jgi:Zn-dependent peptidase ImmA (M78 family)
MNVLFTSDERPPFNPQRLRIARERRGLTKEEFAQLCGVTRRAVTDWEAGRVLSPPIDRVSQILKFPEAFFHAGDLEEVPAEGVSFRALTSVSQRQIRRILIQASMIRLFSQWIDDRYTTPSTDIPSIEDLAASQLQEEPLPVDAADSLRTIWGLGVKPVSNMLTLLESQGVRVFALVGADHSVDAFSFWHDKRAFIFLNIDKTAERLRFDLAHELGHLCMHHGIQTNRSRRFELDANTFASAFLIPGNGLSPQIVGRINLNDVFTLKKYWKVSATAMVQRLRHLEYISEWQHRTWMIDLSERGFRTSEPDGIDQEQSSLLRQVLTLAREDGWSIKRIADNLGFPFLDLSSALTGLTVTQLPPEGFGDLELRTRSA